MPFPFLALAGQAVSMDSQARAEGGPGLFELQSLRSGPQAGDQYGAFKPGGMFAPPSFDQFSAAARGRDTGRTIASALFPGIGQAVSNLFSGPGRGQTRRAGAREMVAGDPGLSSIQASLRASGLTDRSSATDIARAVAAIVARSPQAGQSLAGVFSRAQSLGGIGSAQGEQANQLGDVLKATFGLGTVRKRGAASAEDVLGALAPMLTTRSTPAGFAPQQTAAAPSVQAAPQPFQAAAPSRPSSYWAGTAYKPRYV